MKFKPVFLTMLVSVVALLVFSCATPETGDTAWRLVGAAGQPVFQGAWTNYDTVNYESVGFRKDSFGWVHLKGFGSGGAASTNMFILPAGYAPAKTIFFEGYSGTGACSITVQRVGSTAWVVIGAAFNTFISLNGVDFLAE